MRQTIAPYTWAKGLSILRIFIGISFCVMEMVSGCAGATWLRQLQLPPVRVVVFRYVGCCTGQPTVDARISLSD